MNPRQMYLDNLRKFRPTMHAHLTKEGQLDQAADEAQAGYLKAQAQYRKNGLSMAEATDLASQDWLTPISEREEKEQANQIDREEKEAKSHQLNQLAAGMQGYDPNKKGRQEYYLADGRRVVRTGNREMVFPLETSASTPPKSDSAAPKSNTETT
jgi:hypothetical protein